MAVGAVITTETAGAGAIPGAIIGGVIGGVAGLVYGLGETQTMSAAFDKTVQFKCKCNKKANEWDPEMSVMSQNALDMGDLKWRYGWEKFEPVP